jgi:hypothetical protein
MVTNKSSERSDRLQEHSMELREFEDADWDGTREDSELLWDLREALSRSVERGKLQQEVPSESAKQLELHESYELPAKDAELLLAELTADPLETNVDHEEEKVENAE